MATKRKEIIWKIRDKVRDLGSSISEHPLYDGFYSNFKDVLWKGRHYRKPRSDRTPSTWVRW